MSDRTAVVLRPERWVLWCALVTTAVLIALHVGVGRVPWAPQWGAVDSPTKQYFDVAREQNLPTWMNVVVLALAASVSGVAAALARVAHAAAAQQWAVFALVLAGLSLDDMTSLHERLAGFGRRIGGGSGLTYASWLVPGLAFAALVVVVVALLVRRVDRTTRRLLVSGLFLLLLGAFGFESVGNAVLERQGYGRDYAWLVLVEESLETLGAWLLLAAPVAQLRFVRGPDGLLVGYAGVGRSAAQSVR